MEIYPDAQPFADPSKGPEDESTLAILVPAAELLVRDYRVRHDTSASEGMPAHVTIIWPFMHPDDLTDQTIGRIRDLLARSEPIAFSLGDIGQFNGQVLYLRPEPGGPINNRGCCDPIGGRRPDRRRSDRCSSGPGSTRSS